MGFAAACALALILWLLLRPGSASKPTHALEDDLASAKSRIRALEESLALRDRVREKDDVIFAHFRRRMELAEEIVDDVAKEHGDRLSDDMKRAIAALQDLRSKRPTR